MPWGLGGEPRADLVALTSTGLFTRLGIS